MPSENTSISKVSAATVGEPSSTSVVSIPSEPTKEDLELAASLIEHSQSGRTSVRERQRRLSQPQQHQEQQLVPTALLSASTSTQPDRRPSPSSTEGESRSNGEVDEQARLSDDGLASQNMSLPSIHELTWVKQRKPFNTGMGGAGQVCRYVFGIKPGL